MLFISLSCITQPILDAKGDFMKEHLPSHDHEPQEPVFAPRLGYQALVDYIRPFSECRYEPEFNRIVIGEQMDELLTNMRTDHPSVVNRAECVMPLMIQSVCITESDMKNFKNCYIVGYGMIRAAYIAKRMEIPQDTEQHPWFSDPMMKTTNDIFHGIAEAKARITHNYPDLPVALHTFLDMSQSYMDSPFAHGMATFAASEMHDAFQQIEKRPIDPQYF